MPAARGRPPKFGRPARLVALTLPEDVLHALGRIHADPAWAIVTLVEGRRERSRKLRREIPLAEIVRLPRRGGLIVVRPEFFRRLNGVAMIPLADGRAFLALQQGRGIADLELAVIDRLEARSLAPETRAALERFRLVLRSWRRTPGLTFRTRSIIMVERVNGESRAAATPLRLRHRGGRQRAES